MELTYIESLSNELGQVYRMNALREIRDGMKLHASMLATAEPTPNELRQFVLFDNVAKALTAFLDEHEGGETPRPVHPSENIISCS